MAKKTVPNADFEDLERLVLRMRGRRLPPERELAKQFNISRARVRWILDQFEAKGLVARQQGSGTYALEEGSTAVSSVVLLVDARLKLGTDLYFSTVVEQVQQVCQTEGIRCTLERLAPGDKPVILEDGIIAVGPAARDVLERLMRRDVPAVGLFTQALIRPGMRVTLLDIDQETAGRRAAQYLLQQHCRRLLFLGLDPIRASSVQLRGAIDASRESSCDIKKIDCDLDFASGLSHAAQLVIPDDGSCIGIIAANGWLALGLHTGLMMRSLKIRSSVRLVTFESVSESADLSLDICSLQSPLQAMATDAVSELRRLATSPLSCGREIFYPVSDV